MPHDSSRHHLLAVLGFSIVIVMNEDRYHIDARLNELRYVKRVVLGFDRVKAARSAFDVPSIDPKNVS